MKPSQLTLLLAGLVALLSLVGLTSFWLSHQALNEKSTRLSAVLSDIMLVNQQLESFDRLEAEYEEIGPLQEQVYEVLPTEKRQTEVTLQLDSIVDSIGVQLSGLNFQSTSGRPGEISQTLAAEVPGVLVMPVQFQITSSYAQFVELLQKIENQQRYMQINDLSISRAGSNQLQFNVNLEVFLKP
ncbi:MAG: type 4a pilus biogenesis protein PilO [Candidatus Saccharimonadales bacterium]